MKTLIILFLCILFLGSCKKDKTCWYCTFATVNGVQRPPETICNEGEQPGPFTDAQGNDIGVGCTRQ